MNTYPFYYQPPTHYDPPIIASPRRAISRSLTTAAWFASGIAATCHIAAGIFYFGAANAMAYANPLASPDPEQYWELAQVLMLITIIAATTAVVLSVVGLITICAAFGPRDEPGSPSPVEFGLGVALAIGNCCAATISTILLAVGYL